MFEVRRRHAFGFSINQPGDVNIRPLDLETGAFYYPWGGQPSYKFRWFCDFRSRHIGQKLSDKPGDFATLTFDLGGHGLCRRHESTFSICVPTLKYVCLSVRKKLWLTSSLSISRPGDLDLWALTLKLVLVVARGVGNFATNLGVSVALPSRLMGQHLSDASHNLVTLTFYIGGHGACRRYVSSCSTCVQSLTFISLSVRKTHFLWHD